MKLVPGWRRPPVSKMSFRGFVHFSNGGGQVGWEAEASCAAHGGCRGGGGGRLATGCLWGLDFQNALGVPLLWWVPKKRSCVQALHTLVELGHGNLIHTLSLSLGLRQACVPFLLLPCTICRRGRRLPAEPTKSATRDLPLLLECCKAIEGRWAFSQLVGHGC